MKEIILSILIPVYNVENYLRKCLESVMSQVTEECEVIIVDDGSTDGSPLICDEYLNTYSNSISVIHKENQGAYPTRNVAMDHASGEYLWFIDPDDYIEEGSIKKILDYVRTHNYIDILSMSYRVFDDKKTLFFGNNIDKEAVISGQDYIHLYQPDPYLWNKVYKRSFLLINNLKFHDHLTSQGDWLFNMKAFVKAANMGLTCIYGYNYYKGNPNSTLNSKDIMRISRNIHDSIIAETEYNEFVNNFKNTNVYSDLINWQSYNIAGFFYALYINHCPVHKIRSIIKQYTILGMYPIPKGRNWKSNLFRYYLNDRLLFLSICWLHNKISP